MMSNGVRFLFESPAFHYQALRALGHANYQGAAPGEVMVIISKIEDKNEESWYQNWYDFGEKVELWSEQAPDPISKGNTLLRASNYYRASDFFLKYHDNRRLKLYKKSQETFQKALEFLNINHAIYQVPYEHGKMTTYYFPGDADKPLTILIGGYDSTNEESYFWMGAALIARGFPVAMFEGPGQSGMIREYDIKYTHDWHKPLGMVIDHLENTVPGIKAKKKVLLGISMGSVLAARAAAFEKRVDGIGLFGGPFDMFDIALNLARGDVKKAYARGDENEVNSLLGSLMKVDMTNRWAVTNGLWTMGGETPSDYLNNMKPYTCKDIHDKVTCPVLVFYGEKDLYVADGVQDVLFANSFKNAKSHTMKAFYDKDGSAEHCQIGSIEQATMTFVQWMKENNL